ncbi:MAG TPA: hypothetical protein VGA93_05945 [Actinomycetota bacterium]
MEELIAGWRAAEARLYPLVMAQPELYERYLAVVRAVADDLRSARTPQQLAEAFGGRAAILKAVVASRGFATDGLDLELVAQAAFGLRYREVVTEVHREDAIRRVREAGRAGLPWVVLRETAGAAGPFAAPYDRLEMHVPSGVGLHAFVELGPEMDRPRFGVEVVQLDPGTGDPVSETAPPAELRTYGERDRWEDAIEELRRRIGGGPA